MTSIRYCLSCGKPLQLSPSAPHKKFCGMLEGDWAGACRNEHHAKLRQRRVDEARRLEEQADAALSAQEQGELPHATK